MYHKIIDESTPQQSQVALSAATAELNNDQTDENPTPILNRIISSTNDRLFIHYMHEKRFRRFKKDLHQVYENAFKNTTVTDVTLIVGNRNRRNATNELINKKPKLSLLRNEAHRIKTKYLRLLGELSSSFFL
jgi:hypothetical protein